MDMLWAERRESVIGERRDGAETREQRQRPESKSRNKEERTEREHRTENREKKRAANGDNDRMGGKSELSWMTQPISNLRTKASSLCRCSPVRPHRAWRRDLQRIGAMLSIFGPYFVPFVAFQLPLWNVGFVGDCWFHREVWRALAWTS